MADDQKLANLIDRIISMGREACDYLDHAAGIFTAHSPKTCHICQARRNLLKVPPK